MPLMPAYRLVEWLRPPELVEVPVPEPGPGQVRVKVAGCGLCHSDFSMLEMPGELGDAIGWQVPFTLGHEAAGWVDAWGPGVAGFAEGDPVAVSSPSSCGVCRWCVRGQENACPNGLVGRGYGRDGSLAEYVLVDDPGRLLYPLGDLDPRIAGPLTDAGATSHHAVRRVLAHLDGEGAAVVVGVGGLGGFVVQILRARTDAPIIAIEPDPGRRAHALALGATHVVDGVGPDTGGEVRALAGAAGVDAVIDLVGTDDTIAFGASALAPGGALGIVGAAGGTLARPWFSGLPRDGAVFTFQGSDRADARGVLDLAASGAVQLEVATYPLAEVARAYDDLHHGRIAGRAVVAP